MGSVPAFGIVNASLNWLNIHRSHFDMTFWIKNLTDKTYELGCDDNTTTLGYKTCHFGDPLTFAFQGRYNF